MYEELLGLSGTERQHRPVSATVEDWSREAVSAFRWDPGKQLLRCIRKWQYWRTRWGIVGRLIAATWTVRHRFWSVVTASDIPPSTRIAGGLYLPHPNGIVVHSQAVIGPNCLLFHQVTLGEGGKVPGVPRLGGHVDVGAGAKILGGVVIGDHAKIGANAVVLCDVPAGATAVGIPARVVGGGMLGEHSKDEIRMANQ